MSIDKLLTDLLNLKTYSTFPDVTPNYMGVEMEYEGRLKDVPVSNEVVKVADIKAIIAKYVEDSTQGQMVIIPNDSYVVEFEGDVFTEDIHIEKITDMVARKLGHAAICKAYVVIAVDSLGTGVVIKNVGKGVGLSCPNRGTVLPKIMVHQQLV